MLLKVMSLLETINRGGSYLNRTYNKYLQTLHYNLQEMTSKMKGDKKQLYWYLARFKLQLPTFKSLTYKLS